MQHKSFDSYAEQYDLWFLENKNLLYSEVNLVAHFLNNAQHTLSVGCGSGLFESILEKEYNIIIKTGIEPSAGMAEIARKRGLNVTIATAEDANYGIEQYNTILFNGTPSYIGNIQVAFEKSFKALKSGGKIVVIDVPKESGYGVLYNLAKAVGAWNNELLEGVYPRNPYPIELVNQANWRTTKEKIDVLQQVGFVNLEFAQTLTKHPIYSNNVIEQPIQGYDSGDYVAICAYKA